MGFGYILAGIVFLFNPNLHVLDFLPDFIGILLIYRGLFRMSFSTDKLRDTRTALWKLAIITAVRSASFLFMPGTSESFKLLLVFTFGVLETVFAIPAVVSAFEGMYDLGIRYDAQSVYAVRVDRRGRSREQAERLKVYTIFFFLIKTAASILPELTALQLRQDLSADAHRGVFLSDFKPYFYFLAFTITLVCGIVWLVRTWRYVQGLRRDENLANGVTAHYTNNVAADAGVMAALQMKNVLLMVILAALLTFPLQFDGLYVLPAFVPAILLCLVWRILVRFDRLAVYGWIFSGVTTLLSAWSLFLQVPYSLEYDAEAGRYIANAIRMYMQIRVVGALEYAAGLATFGYLFFLLFRVFKQHAEMVGGVFEHPQYSAAARAAEILHSVNGRLVAVCGVGFAYFVLRAVSFTAAMYYPAFWFIPTAVSLVFVAVTVYAVSGATDMIYERLENKY